MRPLDTDLSARFHRTGRGGQRTLLATAIMAVLSAFANPIAQADDTADLSALKQQVQKLQQQVSDLEARRAAQASQSPASESRSVAPAPQSAATGSHPAAAGALNASDAQGSSSNSPSFYAGPVKVTLGGFVEMMIINRNRNESADWASNFNTSIPYPNSHNYAVSEFHLTERQSRLQALAEGPDSADYATEAYVETDFGGAGGTANNNESSSFSPRVRHFYADLQNKNQGWYFLFGQTWSLVTAEKIGMSPRQENIVPTIDGQYIPGFSWLRVSQIRWVKKLGELANFGVSLENPAAQVTSNASTGAPALNTIFNNPGATNSYTAANNSTATNISTDYLPDVIAKFSLDPGWGHYEIFGINRWFRARNITTGEQDNVRTSGTGFGANVLLPVVPQYIDFQAGILAGKGIGRYGSAQLPDATVNPGTLGLEPLRGYQALVGFTVRPTSTVTLFAFAGKEQVDAQAYTVVSAGKAYGYGYGSDLFVNSGCETEGAGTCSANTSSISSGMLGGWWKAYQGSLGNLQIGLTDTYLKREIFAGVGGDPSTNINIVDVSFRYFPYQK